MKSWKWPFSTKKKTLKCQAKSNRYWIQISRCNRPFSWIHVVHQNWPEYQTGLLQFWICNLHKTSINIPPFNFLINSHKYLQRKSGPVSSKKLCDFSLTENLRFSSTQIRDFCSKRIWDFLQRKSEIFSKKTWAFSF